MNNLMRSFAIVLFSCLLISCNEDSQKIESEDNKSVHEQHGTDFSHSGYIDSVNNGPIEKDTLKGSPARIAMAMIGEAHLHIKYHSPGVKGRIVWGGLVPYGNVWVTGAHNATSIELNKAINILGNKVEPGTYAIFTIPDSTEWQFILNKNYQQHLADDYKQVEDVLRVKVQPMKNKMTQRLTYSIHSINNNSGEIWMEWETIKIIIPFNVVE